MCLLKTVFLFCALIATTTPLLSEENCYTYTETPYETYLCDETTSPESSSQSLLCANRLSLGPEIYYLQRSRRGGTRQEGTIYGVRATYDYIKRYNIYIGAQALYATGTLHGHTGAKAKLRSQWTDELIEGNLGYTFEMKCYPHISFTPFGGYGYFRELNNFVGPSPLHLKFTTSFGYISYGFLSSIFVTPEFNFGINMRFAYPWQPRCRVTNDPDHPDTSSLIGTSFFYRLELPLIYRPCLFCLPIGIEFTPFYASRLYGERENFPFDFFKTRIYIFGATLSLMYQF